MTHTPFSSCALPSPARYSRCSPTSSATLAGARRRPYSEPLGAFQLGVGIALFEGFERAPVALVTLLYFAYPLITVVGAALLFHEEPLRRALILVVALAGVALTIGAPESTTWAGSPRARGRTVRRGADSLQPPPDGSAYPVTPLVLGGPHAREPGNRARPDIARAAVDFDLSGEAWAWAAASVVVGAVIPIGLFYSGIRRVGAGTAWLALRRQLVSVLLAYAVLDESLTALQLVGGGPDLASCPPQPAASGSEATVRAARRSPSC